MKREKRKGEILHTKRRFDGCRGTYLKDYFLRTLGKKEGTEEKGNSSRKGGKHPGRLS